MAKLTGSRNGTFQSKASPTSKRQRPDKESEPIATRRSLRTRAMPPEGTVEKISPRISGPLSMAGVHDGGGGGGSHRDLVATLLSIDDDDDKEEKDNDNSRQLDLCRMELERNNVARLVSDWIMDVKFLPCSDMRMVVVGNKLGNVAFWNIDSTAKYLYRPHTGPISGILFQESCFSKIFTSCYHGNIRMMDADKEAFLLVHQSEEEIYCLSRPPNDDKSFYFGEGPGRLTAWDDKMGKPSSQWFPHNQRINTIHFNPRNPNIMATASTDGTAKIWDLRLVHPDKPMLLNMVSHKEAVNSAYFSPSGDYLATTSLDDCVGLQSWDNSEGGCMIPHYNSNSRRIPKIRAIWGWDDSYIFIGDMKKAVDVISTARRDVVMTTTLESSLMTASPCRFDAHPHHVGMLAGATAGGQVYVWTSN